MAIRDPTKQKKNVIIKGVTEGNNKGLNSIKRHTFLNTKIHIIKKKT